MKQEIERCKCCGHIVSKRKIAIYTGMISALYKVFTYCKEKRIHEVQTKQIKQFFNLNSSARFGDLVMFGGLVYKGSKGHYGLNMQRVDQFFKGEFKIPEYVIKDPITGKIEQGPDITIHQLKGLNKLLNEEGDYKAEYIERNFKEVNVLDYDGTVIKTIRMPK